MVDATSERTLGVVLFPNFELLDVFGPLEAFGNLSGLFKIIMVAERPGPVKSAQGPQVWADAGWADCPPLNLLLVPGGIGTREEVNNRALLDWIAQRAADAEITASVCTGAALLARAGVLDGRRATTNKAWFQWVEEQGPTVQWVRSARWVDDGSVVTSSGVSAGMDMALHVIARLVSLETSENLARMMEYEWRNDPDEDPFARIWGLA